MSLPVASSPSRTRAFQGLVWSSLLIFTLALALFVRSNSHFIADDYDHFIQAMQLPLLQLLATPIDVHYAPLHKLLSALIVHLAPLDFDLALGVMLLFHGLAIGLLYRLLQALGDSPVNLLLVFLYGCNPFVLQPLIWWSSGIHRFPYVCLCLISLYAHVRYRQSLRLAPLLGSCLAFLLAFGFYSKAILIPLYILALELCLSLRDGFAHRLARFAPGVAMLLVSVAYVLWYLHYAPILKRDAGPGFAVMAEIVWLNFKVLLGVLTFHEYDARSLAFNAALGGAGLLAMAYGARHNWRSLWVWALLVACVGVNFAMIAASGRGQAFGALLAYALRYYFEVTFLLALFAGVLFSLSRPLAAPAIGTWHWLALVVCVGYVGVLGWVARPYFFTVYEHSLVAAAHYMTRLLGDLDRLPVDQPLRLARADLPGYVYGDFINARMAMERVLPLRYRHLLLVPRDQADYAVDEHGAVRALRPDVTQQTARAGQ